MLPKSVIYQRSQQKAAQGGPSMAPSSWQQQLAAACAASSLCSASTTCSAASYLFSERAVCNNSVGSSLSKRCTIRGMEGSEHPRGFSRNPREPKVRYSKTPGGRTPQGILREPTVPQGTLYSKTSGGRTPQGIFKHFIQAGN